MNKQIFLCAFLLISSFVMAQDAPLRCGNELLGSQDEELLLERERLVQRWMEQQKENANTREEYIIPVVVHILYKNEEERLTSAQIESQIEVLNEDFNALNSDSLLIPAEFRSLKANVGFTFCLAKEDPEGNPRSGIVYQPTEVDCIANTFDVKNFDNRALLFDSQEGGSTAWDASRYFNIWVGNTCGKFLGQTPPMDAAFPNEDGVIIDYRNFGVGCTDYPFHLGRTTTHEVGHYFGLRHIFSGSSCEEDDGISDTPQQANSYAGCPTYPQSSCGTRDMFMNFMDYVDDQCMRLFTKEQKLRMVATLEVLRPGLLEENKCGMPIDPPIEKETAIFPNPAQHCIYVSPGTAVTGPVNVRLFNAGGQLFYESNSNGGSFIRPIPVEKLPVGVYFLRLEYNGEKETRKVMVVH